MTSIVSSTPGRIRLRHPDLRDAGRLAQLQQTIARWQHIEAIRINPQAGSLIVRYGVEKLDGRRLAQRLDKAVDKLLHQPPVPSPAKPGGTPRVRVNRWAKRGMLASLAISMMLAGAGRKRWHALSGGLFLASLTVHLWIHRRHILK